MKNDDDDDDDDDHYSATSAIPLPAGEAKE
jgi:hypothetical protein